MSLDVGQVAEIIVHVTELNSAVTESFVGPQGPQGEPGLGVPGGGVVDEVLVKLSGVDNDTTWSDDLRMNTVSFKGEYDNGSSGVGKVIDFSFGQKQKITLTSNANLVITPPAGIGNYQLRIIQDATGGRLIGFTGISANRWLGSVSQPDINIAPNGETIMSLYWDGANFVQSLIKVGAR